MATRAERIDQARTAKGIWLSAMVVLGLALLGALVYSGCERHIWSSASCEVWVYINDDGSARYVDVYTATAEPRPRAPDDAYRTIAQWTYLPSRQQWPIAPMKRQISFLTARSGNARGPSLGPQFQSDAETYAKDWLLRNKTGADWVRDTSDDEAKNFVGTSVQYLDDGNPIWYREGIRANIARVILLIVLAGLGFAVLREFRAHRSMKN